MSAASHTVLQNFTDISYRLGTLVRAQCAGQSSTQRQGFSPCVATLHRLVSERVHKLEGGHHAGGRHSSPCTAGSMSCTCPSQNGMCRCLQKQTQIRTLHKLVHVASKMCWLSKHSSILWWCPHLDKSFTALSLLLSGCRAVLQLCPERMMKSQHMACSHMSHIYLQTVWRFGASMMQSMLISLTGVFVLAVKHCRGMSASGQTIPAIYLSPFFGANHQKWLAIIQSEKCCLSLCQHHKTVMSIAVKILSNLHLLRNNPSYR